MTPSWLAGQRSCPPHWPPSAAHPRKAAPRHTRPPRPRPRPRRPAPQEWRRAPPKPKTPWKQLLAKAPPRAIPAGVSSREKSQLESPERQARGALRAAREAVEGDARLQPHRCRLQRLEAAGEPGARAAPHAVPSRAIAVPASQRQDRLVVGEASRSSTLPGRRREAARGLPRRQRQHPTGATAAKRWARHARRREAPEPDAVPVAMPPPEARRSDRAHHLQGERRHPRHRRLRHQASARGRPRASSNATATRQSWWWRGHADSSEKNAAALAKKRAEAVAKWLRDAGIPAAQIEVKSFGSSYPVDSAASGGSAKPNRRVDFEGGAALSPVTTRGPVHVVSP